MDGSLVSAGQISRHHGADTIRLRARGTAGDGIRFRSGLEWRSTSVQCSGAIHLPGALARL